MNFDYLCWFGEVKGITALFLHKFNCSNCWRDRWSWKWTESTLAVHECRLVLKGNAVSRFLHNFFLVLEKVLSCGCASISEIHSIYRSARLYELSGQDNEVSVCCDITNAQFSISDETVCLARKLSIY